MFAATEIMWQNRKVWCPLGNYLKGVLLLLGHRLDGVPVERLCDRSLGRQLIPLLAEPFHFGLERPDLLEELKEVDKGGGGGLDLDLGSLTSLVLGRLEYCLASPSAALASFTNSPSAEFFALRSLSSSANSASFAAGSPSWLIT